MARADLRALGLTKQRVTLATTADVNFRGLTLDQLEGQIQLRCSTLGYDEHTVAIDTFDVVSTPRRRAAPPGRALGGPEPDGGR